VRGREEGRNSEEFLCRYVQCVMVSVFLMSEVLNHREGEKRAGIARISL
jgi:hypothetical protein